MRAQQPSYLPGVFDTETAKLYRTANLAPSYCAIAAISIPVSTPEEVSLLLIVGFPKIIQHLDSKHSVDGTDITDCITAKPPPFFSMSFHQLANLLSILSRRG